VQVNNETPGDYSGTRLGMWVSEEPRASQAESVHPNSKMLMRAFNQMRGERTAPRREDLDLKQIRKLVPSLFIAEQTASSGDFRWRLAGTAISRLMGHEVTGRSVMEGWDRQDSEKIRRFFSKISGTHRPDLLRLRFMTDKDQWLLAQIAAVPLMAADGLTTQVLGGLFTLPDQKLKHYDAITAREVVSAREVPAQQRFRVITGGR
jgi:hypothetical protein